MDKCWGRKKFPLSLGKPKLKYNLVTEKKCKLFILKDLNH
jgi:hypothetical protein